MTWGSFIALTLLAVSLIGNAVQYEPGPYVAKEDVQARKAEEFYVSCREVASKHAHQLGPEQFAAQKSSYGEKDARALFSEMFCSERGRVWLTGR